MIGRRFLPVLLALASTLALLVAAPSAGADRWPPPEPVKCTCLDGNACYHWLNAPSAAPWDPCSCSNCRNEHTCPRTYPAEWNLTCARSGRLDCFLRRHSASWKLTCSSETGDCKCPGDDSSSCPECGTGGSGNHRDPEPIVAIRKQFQMESKLFRNEDIVVVRSPHFYLVTDIPGLKVLTQNGSKREFGTHELAHLYIQRAELAYKDFVRTFGAEIRTNRPFAIFLNKRRADSERVQSQYFGRPNAGYVYGIRGESTPPISGGICEAGVAASFEAQPSDDALHVAMRTSIGSVLMSLWHRDDATPPHLPMWVMVGAGHWLGRVPEPFADKAYFVGGEGNAPLDDGHDWMKRLVKDFLKDDLANIDSFLGFSTLSQMDLPSHVRAWGLFKLFVEEDHDRFVTFLKLVREGKNQRESVLGTFGVTPDELDARWRERVTGKRKSLGDERPAAAAGGGTPPSEMGFERLTAEHDPRIVADRIKARKSIDDVDDAKILVSLLARDDDAVTERVVLSLSKADDDDVREYLRGEALESSRGRVKAGIARILALSKDRRAADFLMKLLGEPDPLVREQCGVAMGRLRHLDAIPALRKLVADSDDSVSMAAMDALAAIGDYAADEWTYVAPKLGHARRCVRTCAAETLGSLGSMASIDALIARMETEGGRVRLDIREALKKITRDDLGAEPGAWKAWWEKEKANSPNGLPKRPPESPKPDPNSRYAGPEPAFYGVEMFSKRLAFVIDVSSSMSDKIALDPEWMSKSGRTYRASAEKYDLAVAEIGAALKALDQRTQFDVVTFRSDAGTWRDRLVSASSGTVADAMKYLQKEHPLPLQSAGDPARQKTNLADALRIVFGIAPGAAGRPTDEAADEAYVLTDGQPTAGDLVDADVLLQWFREKNRTARIRVNVFTFETIDVDLTFLRALAMAGNGAFVAVPTAKR